MKTLVLKLFCILLFISSVQAFAGENKTGTTDHSKHMILQQEFQSGQEVTAACLSCHTEAGKQIQKTIHWTWICPHDPDKKLGKGGYSLNNFCISLLGNWPRCTSCHAGFGWKDKSFDFNDETNIDCLVCHEQTGTYYKFPSGAGYPVKEKKVFKGNHQTYYPPDWNKVAQSVGLPKRKNCGVCHFYGGGGDGVKHGDLDSSLFYPSKNLDVHMAVEGENFPCVECHTTVEHSIAGRCYKTPASTDRKSLLDFFKTPLIACESCHSQTPHKNNEKINDHTDKVACQSCHIPAFARVNPTKVRWDWSKAGMKKDGKPYVENGDMGKPVYMSKKGEFVWEKNVVPEYFWFNGVIENVLLTDRIDPTGVVKINNPKPCKGEPNARIHPFKVHKGKQPYDKVNQTMVAPKLFGEKGSGAFWSDFDWKKSITASMKTAGLKFSGEHGFVETEYHYPTNHMVAPAKNALSCKDCHIKKIGRLEKLKDFYMPARDGSLMLDYVGWAGVFLSLIGVLIHGFGRIISRKHINTT